MAITVDKDRCPHDHACPLVSICPKGAIKQEGFNAPTIDNELCSGCGFCLDSCPHGAVSY